MPLVLNNDYSSDNSFVRFSDLSERKDNNRTPKILTIDSEESCYSAYRHRDAECIRISADPDFIDDSVFEGFTQLRQVLISSRRFS